MGPFVTCSLSPGAHASRKNKGFVSNLKWAGPDPKTHNSSISVAGVKFVCFGDSEWTAHAPRRFNGHSILGTCSCGQCAGRLAPSAHLAVRAIIRAGN